MADNVGNPDARPDLDLEGEFGEDEGTIDEQEMADAEAGCGEVGLSIPVGEGGAEASSSPASGDRPDDLQSLSSPPEAAAEAPSGHPATVASGHPAGVPGGPDSGDRQRHFAFRPRPDTLSV